MPENTNARDPRPGRTANANTGASVTRPDQLSGPPLVMTTDHPRAQCIDLRATYGRTFRYVTDPSHGAERPEYRAVERPWLTCIDCRKGFIYPYGGCTPRRSTRRQLAALPFMAVDLWGDSEAILVFDAQHVDEVAAIMGAKRRRQVSEAQCAVLARARELAQAGRKTLREGPESARETTIGASDDQQPDVPLTTGPQAIRGVA